MKSVFDHLQDVRAASRSAVIIGLDPDLHTSGLAIGQATWKVPRLAPPTITSIVADLVRVPSQLRGLEAADAMAAQLAIAIEKRAPVLGNDVIVVIESQQVYPDEDMPRNEMVAKANDLLRLSHVSGAMAATAAARRWQFTSVLPFDWKGTKAKDKHHIHIRDRLVGMAVTVGGQPFGKQSAMYGHAVDAIGLVLYGIEEASRGLLPVYTYPTP